MNNRNQMLDAFLDRRGVNTDRNSTIAQWIKAKERYPDHLLFVQAGEYFELFSLDAKIAARALERKLFLRKFGKRKIKIAVLQVPKGVLEQYLARLLTMKHKVAVCGQTV